MDIIPKQEKTTSKKNRTQPLWTEVELGVKAITSFQEDFVIDEDISITKKDKVSI